MSCRKSRGKEAQRSSFSGSDPRPPAITVCAKRRSPSWVARRVSPEQLGRRPGAEAPGWPVSREARRMRRAPAPIPSFRRRRPEASASTPPPRRLGGACGAGRARRRDNVGAVAAAAAPPPVPAAAAASQPSCRGPGGARRVQLRGPHPRPPRRRDGDSLVPGEGAEAERAAPAHPVQAAEGGGQQVLRRLRG